MVLVPLRCTRTFWVFLRAPFVSLAFTAFDSPVFPIVTLVFEWTPGLTYAFALLLVPLRSVFAQIPLCAQAELLSHTTPFFPVPFA